MVHYAVGPNKGQIVKHLRPIDLKVMVDHRVIDAMIHRMDTPEKRLPRFENNGK